jgi:hypothetical protein
MKIQSDLHAGMTFQQCDSQRNFYKNHVRAGTCSGEPSQPLGACHKVFDTKGTCLYKECPYPPFNLPCR